MSEEDGTAFNMRLLGTPLEEKGAQFPERNVKAKYHTECRHDVGFELKGGSGVPNADKVINIASVLSRVHAGRGG